MWQLVDIAMALLFLVVILVLTLSVILLSIREAIKFFTNLNKKN
jgi:hypothetical protein